MQFKEFSKYLQQIENTAGRNDITVLLSELYGHVEVSIKSARTSHEAPTGGTRTSHEAPTGGTRTSHEAKYAMYLLLGRLAPKFVPLEFNFSQKLILKALETLTQDAGLVKNLYKTTGDVGSVVEAMKMENKLSSEILNSVGKLENSEINTVYGGMKEIALASGSGSQDKKINSYLKIINTLDPLSCKYVTRMIVGTIRLGLSEKTILDSLSWFVAGDKSLRLKLDSAFGKKADLGELFEIVLENKSDINTALEKLKVAPGIPIASKLVEREMNSAGVWERMPNCFVQPKLDGLRGQLHYSTKNFEDQPVNVSIFSRNMETMTDQFPELTESLANLGVESIILDSEIIGYDSTKDTYLSYQETMQRRRKYDIGKFSKNIPVRAMCFDILYLNGEDLTQKPLEERISILKDVLDNKIDSLRMLETIPMESPEQLEEYFKSKVENGLEGIITKQLGTAYDPGTRNFKWIKLKANTRSDLVDTIDVAVLGYYYGKGDRSRFGFGTLLAGVYDSKEDKYYSIGKVGSGFTEEMMLQMYKDLAILELAVKPENVIVDKILFPNVWVQPKIVMEIIADEITRSPAHTAAKGKISNVPKDDSAKGLSIRFPRMKIWNRDKDYPNTIDEIIRMYELRKGS